MSKGKTCGECKYHDKYSCLQQKNIAYISPTHLACIRFCPKNPTNADRIRQMSNAELAKLIVPKVMFCDGCPVKCEEKDIPQSKINPFGADVIEDVCTKRVEAWLNAPADGTDTDVLTTAESEVSDE
jgi:hypothetical protein